ncbi:hypothetical protein EJ06DRAFT_522473 [Trichodelitschia bisporula]|uniref:Uncharacterized protein n=1 Tax=Trichodelitschia bisporula TaxID=703511 RepID=A0A6G1HUK2_9PEZI|nr:hypothetical protein EJ06DRAFT_522473 [Trichodelitschia bisporula]
MPVGSAADEKTQVLGLDVVINSHVSRHGRSTLYHTSVAFFHKTMGYKYCFVPATTDTVSSPMGLGSDYERVSIPSLGQKAHLADSMQFPLEYFLPVEDDGPGAHYV